MGGGACQDSCRLGNDQLLIRVVAFFLMPARLSSEPRWPLGRTQSEGPVWADGFGAVPLSGAIRCCDGPT